MKQFLILFAGVFGLYSLSRIGPIEHWLGLDFSLLQILVFPCFVYLLTRVRIDGQRVPTGLLALAVILATSAVSYGYTSRLQGERIIVARLSGDEFEAKTRILATALRRSLEAEIPVSLRRSHTTFASFGEIERAFAGNRGVVGVVWGKQGWLQLSLPLDGPFFAGRKFSTLLPDGLLALTLVRHVPSFGLATEPEGASLRFLSDVLAGIELLSGDDGPDWDAAETYLRSAAFAQSTWSTFAHKSFPLFLLGNYYLEKAVTSGSVEMGTLRCALLAYHYALSYVNSRDNPELRAALENNAAVALVAESLIRRGGGRIKRAKTALRSAAFSYRFRDPFGGTPAAWEAAHQNLLTVRQLQKEKRRMNGKSPQRKHKKGKRGKRSGRS